VYPDSGQNPESNASSPRTRLSSNVQSYYVTTYAEVKKGGEVVEAYRVMRY
jgi:hypothetical protein